MAMFPLQTISDQVQSIFRKTHIKNTESTKKDKKQKKNKNKTSNTAIDRRISLQLASYQVVQKSIFLLFNLGATKSGRGEILVVIIPKGS